MTEESFEGYMIIEQLGHRRLAGYVTETTVAGAGFLRVDVPATDGHEPQSHLISPSSVYALHPTTEEIATAVAARCRPEPVHRWELPAAQIQPRMDESDYDDPDADDDLDDEEGGSF